jgi:hypothetical protein
VGSRTRLYQPPHSPPPPAANRTAARRGRHVNPCRPNASFRRCICPTTQYTSLRLPPPHPPQERLRLPWPPLFSEEEVQRGTAYYGSGARLRRVAAKLLNGQPITVVTLGGSVTSGSGVPTPQQNYASRFFQFINSSFPHRCGRQSGCAAGGGG